MAQINDILSKLEGVKSTGSNKYQAKCPHHKDNRPSLSIKDTDDKILLYCHAGCSVEDILQSIGLTERDLFKESENINTCKPKKQIEKIYQYTDIEGNVIHEKVRYSDKSFSNRRIENDKTIWNMQNVTPVIYNLPKVVQAINKGEAVYLVEGEKDADRLNSLGLTATTNFEGAGRHKFKKSYAKYFVGADVVVIQDSDESGRDAADTIVNILFDVARSIKNIDLGKISKYKGFDVTDYFDIGYTREEFLKMVEEAPAINKDNLKHDLEDGSVCENEKSEYVDIKVTKSGLKILPTIANFKVLIQKCGIKIQYNIIKRKIDIQCEDTTTNKLLGNENRYDNLITVLIDNCVKEEIYATRNTVAAWIDAVANENAYNHIVNCLEKCNAPNGAIGKSHFDHFVNCLDFESDKDFSILLLKKWLIQCVAMMHNSKGEYGADGVICVKGRQGIGKTTLFRNLGSVFGIEYFKEGSEIDGSKDKLMENTSYWITELGEFKRTSVRDIDSLKAFITNSSDEFRNPYMRKASKRARYTSFCATVNDDAFLKDAENRRFWTIEIKSIDLKKVNQLDYESLWGEVYAWYIENPNGFRLSPTEQEKLNSINKTYRVLSNEEQLLDDVLDWTQDWGDWKEKTATQIADTIGNNLSSVRVGKALKNRGYGKEHPHLKSRVLSGKTLYLVPERIKTDSIYNPFDIINGGQVVVGDVRKNSTPPTANAVNTRHSRE